MTAIPYLIVDDAIAALDFYQQAFGATEYVRLADPSGKVMHAEVRVGDAAIMLADEFPDMGFCSPKTLGGSAVSILLYVDDVDTVFARAIAAGAISTMPVTDQFDGDRRGRLIDPFGHVWIVGTKGAEISPDELKQRFNTMFDSDFE
jgi:PhnB protein